MGSPAGEVLGDASICSDNGAGIGGSSVRSTESYEIINQNESGVSGTSSMTPVAASPPRSAQQQGGGSSVQGGASSTVNSPSSNGRPTNPHADSPTRSIQGQQPASIDQFHTPIPAPVDPNSIYGVQQLEIQQERGYYTHDQTQGFNPSRGRSLDNSEDDQTDPTSSTAGAICDSPAGGYTRSDNYASKTFEKIRKRISSSDRKRTDSGEDDDLGDAAVIDGYLEKLGRNGKWQTRWFETDGECLTYYKSSKRVKLMATLDLAKVGSIVINSSDPTGCCFTINISERPYHLRAESKAACRDWVITLNRVKEARMQQGNVKLVSLNHPPDLLDEHYTPRVVVVANRQRTRAVDDEDIHSWEGGGPGGGIADNPFLMNTSENPDTNPYDVAPPSSNRLARWQKPRTSLSRLASKLVRWARSLRKYSCTVADNHVVLDHHLHPPGHDDMRKRQATSPQDLGTSDGSGANNSAGIDSNNSISHSIPSEEQVDDDEEEPRLLS